MQTTQQRNTTGSDVKQAGTSSSTGSAQNSEVLSQSCKVKDPMYLRPIWGAADSGSAFANMAGGLLDSIAPDEGSSVKLKITGAIPLYKTPGVEVTFKPTLEMGVERIGKDGHLYGSICWCRSLCRCRDVVI